MSTPLSVLLDLLFPPRCAFCGKILKTGEKGMCAKCQVSLPWLAGSAAEQTGEFYKKCVSPLRYQGEVRASIHRYKFKGIRGYAALYGDLVAQCVGDHLAQEYDIISWVPLSAKRKRARGYDQAFLLAQATALALGDAAAETLRKRVDTGAQSHIDDPAARRANVLGAYEVVDPELIADRRILLIDDVVTSGATLSECARVLRTAGAKSVVCATLARAR